MCYTLYYIYATLLKLRLNTIPYVIQVTLERRRPPS